MFDSRGFRELLVADVAVVRGVASAPDVANALERFWSTGDGEPSSVGKALVEQVGLRPDELAPVEAEVDHLIAAAGGEAHRAVAGRGELTLSVVASLSKHLSKPPDSETGVGQEVGLRVLPSGRYSDFLPAGEGGMGVVYMALDTELRRMVAFKMIRPDAATGVASDSPTTPIDAARPSGDTPAARNFENLEARFLQEAWVTGGLEHPGIVPVYELGRTRAGVPYYTMKFIRGQRTLADALAELADAPVDERLSLVEPFLKLCDAVGYAHANGVIHRDLKPENVALGDFGEVLLLDWGLAKLRGREDLAEHAWQQRVREFREAGDFKTMAGSVGTPGYMSPEAALGQIQEIDEQSDVYGLGAILFEVLTGSIPFPFQTWVQYVNRVSKEEAPRAHAEHVDVPRGLSEICRRTLTRDKAERTESVEALASAVRQWQASSALEREVQERLREATLLLDDAEQATGEERLTQVDAAAGLLARVTAKHENHPKASDLLGRASRFREEGIRERELASIRHARLREVHRIALGASILFVVAALGLLVVEAIDGIRRSDMEAGAEARFEDAERLPAEEAVAALEALVEGSPEASIVPRARHRLGERFTEQERHERARAAWAETYLEHAGTSWADEALLDLGSAYVRDGEVVHATRAAEAVLGGDPSPEAEARALLLAAEAAFGRRDTEQALGYAEACRQRAEALDTPDFDRLAALSYVTTRYLPVEVHEGVGRTPFAVGTFRPGETSLVSCTFGDVSLCTFTDGGLDRAPLPGLSRPSQVSRLHAVDLDGDGVDELVHVTMTPDSEPVDALDVEEVLEVFDLRDGTARRLQSVPVPHTHYVVTSGDVDGDGDLDVLLPSSYPIRGVRVLENDGSGGLDWMDLGEMDVLNDEERANSDVRQACVGDVTGDGANDVVLAVEAWGVFSLMVYSHDPAAGGFVEVPTGPRPMGFVAGCTIADADLDGKADACFGLGVRFYDAVRELGLYPRFLPQGLYATRWDEAEEVFRAHPLEAHRRLLFEPLVAGDPAPVSVGYGTLRTARSANGREDLVALGKTQVGNMERAFTYRILPLGRNLDASFVGRLQSGVADVAAADVDRDGDDEVLVLDRDGRLLVLGRGRLPAPGPVDVAAGRRAESKSRRPTSLRLGQTLFDFEFPGLAERAFRRALVALASTPWAWEAQKGVVGALAAGRRYDDCVRELRGWIEGTGGDEAEAHFLLADHLERSWDLTGAAEAYARLAKRGGLREDQLRRAKERAEALKPWRETTPVELSPFEAWHVTAPGHFRLDEDGGLVLADVRGHQVFAWSSLVLGDSSFVLAYDTRIEAMEQGHTYGAGFHEEDAYLPTLPGVSATVGSTGGGLRQAGVRCTPRSVQRVEVMSERPILGLRPGVWYRFRLTHDRPNDRLGLVVRERGTGKLVKLTTIPDLPRGFAGERRMGVVLDGHGWNAALRVRVANLSLSRPSSAAPIRSAPLTDAYTRANALLACGREADALRLYRRVARDVHLGVLDHVLLDLPQMARAYSSSVYEALLAWRHSGREDGLDRLVHRLRQVPGAFERLVETRPLLATDAELEALRQALR